MNVLEMIKKHEGFRSTPYPDPIHGWGKPTFGHGLTDITEEESEWMMGRRVANARMAIYRAKPWVRDLPDEVKDVMVMMAYQMGVTGLFSFKKFFEACEDHAWRSAADHMLDSRWHEQTPGRAEELAGIIRGLAG